MRSSSGIWLVSVTLALASGAPLLAAGSLGNRVPALPTLLSDDTAAYLSVDAGKFEYGMSSLSLAALLREGEVQEFLAPLYQHVGGIDPADPVASILESSPVSQYLAGEFSIGISGISFDIEGPDGQPTTLRLSASHPINARMLHNLTMLHSEGDWEDGRKASLSIDFLLAIEPGPALRQMAHDFLQSPPNGLEVGQVQMAGVPITAINGRIHQGPSTTIYADLSGDRWLIGGDQSSFAEALKGGPTDSLDRSNTYRNFHGRVAGEGNVLFGYFDAVKLLATFRNLVPPILLEESEMLGIDSLQGLAFGMSMLEGGVRESVLLGFDGNPHGIFSLLDAFGGGFPSLAEAPMGTAAFVGLRFDPKILSERIVGLVKQLAPGVAGQALAEFNQAEVGGLNVVRDILPALGSEVSVSLSQPKNGLIPEVILSMDVQDEAKFSRLLNQARDLAAAQGEASINALALKDGADGFYLTIPDAPIQPAFALRGDRLYGAVSPLTLKNYLYKHAGNPERKTLGNSSEVLPAVLQGLSGGRNDVLTALLYVDLQATVPVLYGTAAPLLPQAFQEAGVPLDPALLPMPETLEEHLTGLAIGLGAGKEGLSIDIFTPTGFLPLAASAGILHTSQDGHTAQTEGDYK